jgi:hypothetical protein
MLPFMCETVDIRNISFEKFVDFFFDRDVPSKDEVRTGMDDAKKPRSWYSSVDVCFDARQMCDYYRRLFSEPRFLLEQYSKAQLEEGFWAIFGPGLDCAARHVIWSEKLPFPLREECVRSMFFLFRDLFFSEPLDTSVYMWWDSFCYDWHCGNRSRDNGGEDMLMQDVMFETLAKILTLESEICQGAALHGLSHLHHPATAELIHGYLAANPSLSDDWRRFALRAAEFTLL